MLERGFADSVEEILAASFNEGNVYAIYMCIGPDFDQTRLFLCDFRLYVHLK